jgi:hypothetical protein
MGNAGSAPEQAKNAVDRAKAEARHMPPSTVRFVPVAADNQARGAACYDRWATALGTGLVEEETCRGFGLAKVVPRVSTKYLRDDDFVVDRLIGFVLDHWI